VSRVLIVAHHDRAEAATLAVSAVDWLRSHGHDACVEAGDAEALDLVHLAPPADVPFDATGADLVLSLGGDGTMLRAVALLDGAAVPLLGVNLGWLGYLTEIEPHALTTALERFTAGADVGSWHLDERLMLDVTVTRAAADGAPAGQWRALNEAVVEKSLPGHTVRLLASIDGEPFTSYAADGLIVATPTGSTAYSLSARGPVVSPRHRALLLTPVAPHMLFDRTLVLDPTERIDIEVMGHRAATLSIDGRSVAELDEGDVVSCGPAAATARFVRFGERRYHQILKAKFGLTDR
jgi:NAD+ kinase